MKLNNRQELCKAMEYPIQDTYDIRRTLDTKPVFYDDLEPETQINIIDPYQGDVQINLSMNSTKTLIEKLQAIYFYNLFEESK